MNKKIFINFLKDKLSVIIAFLLNSFLLILFFNLIEVRKRDILYPTLISFFILSILLLLEWYKYYSFNINGSNPKTIEQRELLKSIDNINSKHYEEINELTNKQKKLIYFISQWIHNLKTPISVIDLMLQKSKDQSLYNLIYGINIENQKLNKSISDVLEIIRLENIEKDFEPRKVDLVASIREVINERKSQFIYSNVFPRLNLDKGEAFVISDKKWNKVVLEQLISNGIKYSSYGNSHKELIIDLKRDDRYTYLTITDNGVGIPEYDLNRVFEPFFTGENGRRFNSSSGIGLYMCREICNKLNHEIMVQSNVNQGTKVTVRYISK